MGLSLRRSYEKMRTPERTVRRGRDPSVPVTLYQEMDSITERLDALTTLIGGSRETLSAILGASGEGGASSPVGTPQKPFVKQIETVAIPLSGTAGAAHSSEWVNVPKKFEVVSAQLRAETATTANVYAEYRDASGNTVQMFKSTAFPAAFKFSTVTAPGDTFVGNEGYGSFRTTKAWDAGSVRFRIANASPSSRVHGSITITAYNEV